MPALVTLSIKKLKSVSKGSLFLIIVIMHESLENCICGQELCRNDAIIVLELVDFLTIEASIPFNVTKV